MRTPGQDLYLVPIDRLWFWKSAEAAGQGNQVLPGAIRASKARPATVNGPAQTIDDNPIPDPLSSHR
jgi:hypothetical protein